MPFPLDPESLVKELRCVHLQCYVWPNALKVTLPSFNIEYYGWTVRGNYNEVSMWFIENQLSPSMENTNETNFKRIIIIRNSIDSTNNVTSSDEQKF